MTSILTSLSFSIHMVEHLYIYGPEELQTQFWRNGVKNMQWLGIFRPFISVKNLYLYKAIAQCFAPALQDLVGEKVTNVLPALKSIFFGRAPVIRTCRGSHRAACCFATALRSPCSCFWLERELRDRGMVTTLVVLSALPQSDILFQLENLHLSFHLFA